VWNEAGDQPLDEHKLFSSPLSNQQFREILPTRNVPTDYELILLIEPRLPPGIRFLTGNVYGVRTLRDDPLQAEPLHACCEVGEWNVEWKIPANGIPKVSRKLL